LALVIWKEHLFDAVKDRLTKKLLELIQKERDGDQIDQNQVAGVIQSYVKLGAIKPQKQLEIYKEDFEVHFINGTKDYYARESTAFISLNGVSAYMKIAENRIQEEEKRSKKYLDSSSYDRVRREIDMVLIDKHKDMMQNECESMFRDDKRDDLSRMYRLLSRIEGLIEPMLLVLQSYVTQQGLEAVKAVQSGIAREGSGPRDIDDEAEQQTNKESANNSNAPAEKRAENPAAAYVEALLATHRQYSEVVATAFKSDPSFVAALDKACRKVVNDNPINKDSTKSPELLAKYCDLLLKKSTKHLDENALEHKLSQVILIFKYVDDKDVFQKFYSKMLAKRLIHATSVSDDAEKFMIAGLKEACGFEYTSKLQRMFNDIQLSVEINERFKEYTTENKVALKVDFNIQVLTAGSWPLQTQASSFNVPFELEVCLKEFHKFYDKLHHGRKLNWLHHLSKGDMRMLYLKKKYEMQATNYQMAVLLNYNEREQFSTQELSQATSLSDLELKRTLLSLLDSKVLKKTSSGRALTPTDEFVLNKTFTSKRIRFKITAPLQAETEKQSADTRKVIDDDRKLYLQAAIVRIMKARKMLNHNNLMREVIDQSRSRFIPSIPMIKKCIEQLIEKEYLKREENDKYSYVA
jgi:cullin 1